MHYPVKTNKELGEGTLKDFNLGYMMMLPLADLKCICGKPLNHQPNHAICAACGLVLLVIGRLLAPSIATRSGRRQATVPTIKITTKNPRISP